MSDFVDRLASLLHKQFGDGPYDDLSLPGFESAARDIISLIREPTPAMRAAADAVIPSGFHWAVKDDFRADPKDGTLMIWQAMIDEALK